MKIQITGNVLGLLAGLLLVTQPANGEVIDSSQNGFTIEFKREINAPVSDVYGALTDNIGQWWLDAHTWYGSGKNMTLTAEAMGCFCEKFGDSETMHMQVAKVEPNNLIRLLGGLGPLQGEGVTGVMEWRMKVIADNRTEFSLFYRVGGYTPSDLSQWAGAVDGVLQQQIGAMKSFVEQVNQ